MYFFPLCDIDKLNQGSYMYDFHNIYKFKSSTAGVHGSAYDTKGSWFEPQPGHCLSASVGLDLVCHLIWKEMPRCSDRTLNRGLVHVACALSNVDFKDSDAHWGREFVRAGYIQISSIQEVKFHKINKNSRRIMAV